MSGFNYYDDMPGPIVVAAWVLAAVVLIWVLL
jgi:hypothetical protein